MERNRRRFHGLVEEFRVSRVQNEQTDFQNVVGSSDHTGGSKRLSPRKMECKAKKVGLSTMSIEGMGTAAQITIRDRCFIARNLQTDDEVPGPRLYRRPRISTKDKQIPACPG